MILGLVLLKGCRQRELCTGLDDLDQFEVLGELSLRQPLGTK